jgi:hemerythrin-like domain-containing protein
MMLVALSTLADRIYERLPAEKETLVNLVAFMQVFVEKCHQEKEENYLFPLLIKKGVPVAGCPLYALIHEHQVARKLTAYLGSLVAAYMKNPAAMGLILATSIYELVMHYSNHIWIANFLLFPIANEILNEKEQQELEVKFELVEKRIGLDVHHRSEYWR